MKFHSLNFTNDAMVDFWHAHQKAQALSNVGESFPEIVFGNTQIH